MNWLKRVFEPQNPSESDKEHSLEWRNKYLMARARYLKTKIEKRGVYVGSIENYPADISEQNQYLMALVEKLEGQLKAKRK